MTHKNVSATMFSTNLVSSGSRIRFSVSKFCYIRNSIVKKEREKEANMGEKYRIFYARNPIYYHRMPVEFPYVF